MAAGGSQITAVTDVHLHWAKVNFTAHDVLGHGIYSLVHVRTYAPLPSVFSLS